jgi:hypothetical protein
MKVLDVSSSETGCNFMSLPMRLESECITGEGIIFDLRLSYCVGALPMEVLQHSTCVTHWTQGDDVNIVLRKNGQDDLWCLRYSQRQHRRGTSPQFTAYLYTDLACPSSGQLADLGPSRTPRNFQLELSLVQHTSLCADEYPECRDMPCTRDFSSQCLKHCKKCNPSISPAICSFPRRFRGDWYLRDPYAVREINIAESSFDIDTVGKFQCIAYDDSPPKEKRMYTTLSMFSNGCRPRYTCVNF